MASGSAAVEVKRTHKRIFNFREHEACGFFFIKQWNLLNQAKTLTEKAKTTGFTPLYLE